MVSLSHAAAEEDDRHDGRGHRGGRHRPQSSPNPWVGCVIVPAGTAPASIGATEPPGGPHAEAAALALAGATAGGATRLRHPGAVQPPRPHARRAPTPSIAAGVRPGGGRHRGSRSAGRGARASNGSAAAGIEVTVGVCAEEVARAAGALPQAPHDRAALGGPQAGGHASTGAPRRPTAPASGSPVRWPGPTPTGCGPRATPCWSAPARCGPTTRP